MAIREGKWRCRHCNEVSRGVELKCSACGKTRDKDVAFFLEDEAPALNDQALLERATAGADWLCLFCGSSSPSTTSDCRDCGAARGTAPSRETRVHLHGAAQPPVSAAGAAVPVRSGSSKKPAVIALLAVAVLLTAIWFLFLRKSEDQVMVAGLEWERIVEIEAFRSVQEEAWESAPAGAHVLRTAEEKYGTEKVQTGSERVKVGTKDLGNGFFEDVYEDRPIYEEKDVYKKKIYYEIDKWVPERKERAASAGKDPRWPEVRLGSNEREAKRKQAYYATLAGEKQYRMEFDEPDRWLTLEPGQRYIAVVKGVGRVVDLRPVP